MEIRFAGKLFLGGTLGALAGAVGLVRLGTAPFLVFRDVLLLRASDPVVPECLRYSGTLALYSFLFGAATLVTLLTWLLVLPPRLIDQEGVRRPWWRNARFWAILVTIAQIGVYAFWG